MRFHAEHSGILDHGAYYAAKSQLDAQGNRIVWGWVRETRPLAEYKAAGWAGMMSLPRLLGLADDGGLRMEFAPAVRVLRRHARNLDPGSNASPQLDQLVIEGGTGEFLGSFRRGDESFTINLVGMLPTGSRSDLLLTLRYDPASPGQVLVDGQPIPIRGAQNGPLELHLYADGAVLEALLQRSAPYTKRFYYPGSAAPRVQIRFEGPPSYIERLSVWQMEPISTNRLARS
jgi:beta-fructofuranosidase